MRIAVTDRHIEQGERSSGSSCAIALAVREMLWADGTQGDTEVVEVGQTRVMVATRNDPHTVDVSGIDVAIDTETYPKYRAHLPEEAQAFVEAFDDDEQHAVEPLTFELQWLRTYDGKHYEEIPDERLLDWTRGSRGRALSRGERLRAWLRGE